MLAKYYINQAKNLIRFLNQEYDFMKIHLEH